MKLKIPKNKRRPFPYFAIYLPLIINRDKPFILTKHFKFTDSSIYLFHDEDQHDVNKLFGFSIGLHHDNSIRFGWRPNKDLSRMEIVGYEYRDKIRIPTIPICEVKLNKWYKYELIYHNKTNEIEYSVIDNDKVYNFKHQLKMKNKYNWGYKLDLYFGGNKKAPHDIIIYKTK
jgi:hypothetical protein